MKKIKETKKTGLGLNTFKARGIVLREYEAGESDKRLVLLCKEHGRLMVYAKGARKPKSKLLAASQLFTYGDYILADGRQFYSVTQAEVIETFYSIGSNYEKLCHGQYLLEICEKIILGHISCDDLLLLLLKSLQNLSQDKNTPLQVVCVFLFRFFLFCGLAPEMSSCCLCGSSYENFADNSQLARFSENTVTKKIAENNKISWTFCNEGILCPRCSKKPGMVKMSLSADTVAAIRYILHSDVNRSFMFRASNDVLAELIQAARVCWRGHFQVAIKSEELL